MKDEDIAHGVRLVLEDRGVAGTWHTCEDGRQLHYWAEVHDNGSISIAYDSLLNPGITVRTAGLFFWLSTGADESNPIARILDEIRPILKRRRWRPIVAGSITTAQIAAGTISAAKIAARTITAAKIARDGGATDI